MLILPDAIVPAGFDFAAYDRSLGRGEPRRLFYHRTSIEHAERIITDGFVGHAPDPAIDILEAAASREPGVWVSDRPLAPYAIRTDLRGGSVTFAIVVPDTVPGRVIDRCELLLSRPGSLMAAWRHGRWRLAGRGVPPREWFLPVAVVNASAVWVVARCGPAPVTAALDAYLHRRGLMLGAPVDSDAPRWSAAVVHDGVAADVPRADFAALATWFFESI